MNQDQLKKVTVLQHSPTEGLGNFEVAFRDLTWEFEYVDVLEKDKLTKYRSSSNLILH